MSPVAPTPPGRAPWNSRALVLAAAWCALAQLASCRGHPEVPILGYHAVVDDPSRQDTTPAQLAAQLDALAAKGFHTVSLQAVFDHQDRARPLPARPIVLTFDDGTADAFTCVLPLLRARGMTATFFVVSSWLGADAASRRREPASDGEVARPELTWPELRALRDAGMEIGSHSRTHPRLPELTDEAALEEMVSSKRELESGLGIPVLLFAYPYNALRARTGSLLQEAGYRAAVAGQDHGGRSREALYRIGVYRETTPEELVGYALAGAR